MIAPAASSGLPFILWFLSIAALVAWYALERIREANQDSEG